MKTIYKKRSKLVLFFEAVYQFFKRLNVFMDKSWGFTKSLFQRRPSWKNRFLVLLYAFSMTLGVVVLAMQVEIWKLKSTVIYSPLPSAVHASEPKGFATIIEEVKVPVDQCQTEKCEILQYIVWKFQDHAADAITLVRKCENSTFDQTRTNHNNNGTTDHGVFQINSIHEKRYGSAFKTEWKANVDVAYQIWKSNGESFRPWTCAYIVDQKNYLGQ